MLKAFSKIEYRQLVGVLYLYLILGLAFTERPSYEPLKDLNGFFGLGLLFVPSFLLPRRWLWIGLWLNSVGLFLFGMLYLADKTSHPLLDLLVMPGTFFLAAVLFAICAVRSRRDVRSVAHR